MTTDRVLIVDDESTVLEFYALQLGGEFALDTAESAEAAQLLFANSGPYSVVVADMHLPGISGSEFLTWVQDHFPDTTRVMLTADNHQSVAVNAVNCGQVFRFLNKPCSGAEFSKIVRSAADQYRLKSAEKALLADTLNGSINLLSEVLALVNPLAFGKARRVKRLVEVVSERLQVSEAWELSIAAMLSQLGCLTLPDSLLRRVNRRAELTAGEMQSWQSHPRLGHDLIARIPRLERIADIVLHQHASYHRAPESSGDDRRSVKWRAGCLRAVLEYDDWIESDLSPEEAVHQLHTDEHAYPPDVLDSLAALAADDRERRGRLVSLAELKPGMILEEHLVDQSGRVLLSKGHEIADWVLARLTSGAGRGSSIREPIRVLDTHADAEPDFGGQRAELPPVPWDYAGDDLRETVTVSGELP